MAKCLRLLLFAVLGCATIAGCATTIPGLPPLPGDEPASTAPPNETGAPSGGDMPDGGALDDTGVPDDAARVGTRDGSNVVQDAGAGFDATGSNTTDAAGGSDARLDAMGPPVLDAMAVCGSNVLTPAAAVASSISGPVIVAGNAIDSNFTTRWESVHAVDPQWIYVDFGAPVFVNRVEIAWEAACAKNYDIQLSKDAATWTTLKAVTGNAAGGAMPPASWTTATIHTGFSGVGRYVRINGTARCTIYGYSMWEMRVFGDTNSVCHM